MNIALGKLVMGTVFFYKGMVLRKASTMGPCDPTTNKFATASKTTKYGTACDLKVGGQWQKDPDVQVWVPDEAVVEVS